MKDLKDIKSDILREIMDKMSEIAGDRARKMKMPDDAPAVESVEIVAKPEDGPTDSDFDVQDKDGDINSTSPKMLPKSDTTSSQPGDDDELDTFVKRLRKKK